MTKNDEGVTKKMLSAETGRLERKMEKIETRLERKIDKIKDEILRHFDAVAENIHQDVAGANKDEMTLLKDISKQHGKRLTKVEKKVGIR